MNANAEWLKARTTGIGGSDVAAILGLSPWRTPLAVYQEKRGEVGPQPDNEAMAWGRRLEPVVRQAYADETGREVRVPADMLRHPTHSFMLANLDGFTDNRRVVEIKTARSGDGWGEAGSDQIPQPYLLQVQHYMMVTGYQVADVAVLIAGSDFRLYEVPADPELHELLVQAETEFWGHVQRAEAPDPITYADAAALWGKSAVRAITATAEVEEAVYRLVQLKAERSEMEALEDAARLEIAKLLGEADTLVDLQGKVLATWKTAAGAKRFDAAAFKEAHPDLHAQFLRIGEPSRRLLLK